MFLVDCHCDTLSELYKQNKSLYANDLMLDAARIIKNGGGLQFMAMFIPTEVFRAGAGATYTLKLIDTYLPACSLWPCSFPQKCSGRGRAQPIR